MAWCCALRASALLALAACASAPPQRDVFLPPYAEKGCWARLYAEPGLAGAMRQLEGPAYVESLDATTVEIPDIERTQPQPLFAEVSSIAVGPHARLTGYAAPLFREQVVALGPGENLSGFSSLSVRSLRLECEAG
jgi:hypothetical protein